MQWVYSALKGGNTVQAATDLCGNPTLLDDLARSIMIAIQRDVGGIFHMAGSEWLSRFDFAIKIARTFGLNEDFIVPVTFKELNLDAPRPLQGGLRTEKVREELGVTFAAVQGGLNTLMARMKTQDRE